MEEKEIDDNKGWPNFFGFYSPIIDGSLASLMNAATPGTPEFKIYGNSEQRYDVLDLLITDAPDNENEEIASEIGDAIASKNPVGLYLRNFALGARSQPAVQKQFNVPQIITRLSMDDIELQNLLKAKLPEVKFLAISNPSLQTKNLPQIVLANEVWQQTAASLINHSGIIVLYYLAVTDGVNTEISLLRNAGAQQRTIVAIAAGDARQKNDFGALFGEAPEKPSAPAERDPQFIESFLADFPHIIYLKKGAKHRTLISKIRDILKNNKAVLSADPLIIPPRPKPGKELLQMARNAALNEFDNGKKHFEAKDANAAEDAFLRSIVFSYWGWDRLGRAIALMSLGTVMKDLHKFPNRAVRCYRYSLNMLVSILAVSPTAREVYDKLSYGLSEYLKSLGDAAGAEKIKEEYPSLPKT